VDGVCRYRCLLCYFLVYVDWLNGWRGFGGVPFSRIRENGILFQVCNLFVNVDGCRLSRYRENRLFGFSGRMLVSVVATRSRFIFLVNVNWFDRWRGFGGVPLRFREFEKPFAPLPSACFAISLSTWIGLMGVFVSPVVSLPFLEFAKRSVRFPCCPFAFSFKKPSSFTRSSICTKLGKFLLPSWLFIIHTFAASREWLPGKYFCRDKKRG
jgi:hypothetical protein